MVLHWSYDPSPEDHAIGDGSLFDHGDMSIYCGGPLTRHECECDVYHISLFFL